MKNFLFSFYGKLSAVFLLLLLILGTVQLYITYQSSMKLIKVANQQLNRDLAANISTHLEGVLLDQASEAAVKSAIHYLMVYNPRIEIYVLDEQGNIINFFGDPKEVKAEAVPLEPIKIFLTGEPQGLILGVDPRNPGERKPFSAAAIDLGGGRMGFVYVILVGEQYKAAIENIRDNYILETSIKTLLVILVLTAIIGLVVFGLLTRRLRTMSNRMEAFEKGDYTARFRDNSRDEMGQLARSFNHMAATIQSSVKELKKTDKLRRNLIANVSHDLRGPLASMLGYIETIIIQKERITNEKRLEYVQVIHKNTRFLRKLVDELFELSKLNAQQVEPDKENFSIAELVQDVVLKLKPQAKKSDVKLSTGFDDSLPQVYADIALIERVLTNLIENAIKYAGDGGEVQVNLKSKIDFVTVDVSDNGPGITEEDLPFIFDRFYRGDKSGSLKGASTGLGLAIAQKIVELHDSEITVESEPGQGSKFTFTLRVYQ